MKYQDPSFLAKYLIRAMQAKKEQLVNNINDELISGMLLTEKKFLKRKIQTK